MAKKNNSAMAGGVLLLIGSLVYLYVLFSWYTAGGIPGPWLSMAQFLAPFVAAVALIGAVSLFFMSLGTAAGKMDKMMLNILWKFIMIEAVATVIVTATSSWFYWALLGFVLTYIGALAVDM